MAVVQRFEPGMVEKYCKSFGLHYLKDAEGDFRVDFSFDEECGCELTLWLMIKGTQSQIYVVRLLSATRIPRSEWPRAIDACNTWNRDHRWPKAYLNAYNPETDAVGFVEVEQQIHLEKGIHQELLDDFTSRTVAGGFEFWRWAHREKHF